MARAFMKSLALSFALTVGGAYAQAQTLLTDVAIVDVDNGTVSDPVDVLITGGKIEAIGASLEADETVVHLDASGRFLIPGLWDSHVHLFSSPTEPDTALPLFLINGVTGVRDMGALWPIAEQKALHARIETGEVLGPRLVLSGAWVDTSPGSWPGMFLADTPEQARDVVARIESEGWAAVKSYSMLSEESYLALAEASEDAGLPLVGHIPERVSLRTAIAAGQEGMEHFGRIPMACSTAEDTMLDALRTAMAEASDREQIFAIMADRNRIILETWDEERCGQILSDMAEAQLYVSPTLVVADFYLGNWPAAETPRMRMLPTAVREAWGKPDFRLEAMTDEVRKLAADSIALDRRTFLMAHEAGVPILASTDASFANPYLFHGFSLLDELDLYVSIGLTPREALYTATVAPPRFFGLGDQDGTIAPGRRADLVLLDANPLENLSTLRRPRAVIVAGNVLDRASLDAMEARLLTEGR